MLPPRRTSSLYRLWGKDDARRARARRLRKEATDAERLLWSQLRRQNVGHRFRRQQPIGRYVVDFFCFEKGLVVEVDGGQHAEQEAAYDAERTKWLESQDFACCDSGTMTYSPICEE